jgi:integrase
MGTTTRKQRRVTGGSVFERNGSWGWRADAGGRQGHRRQRSEQGYATREDAERALTRFLASRPRRRFDRTPLLDLTLRDYLEAWISTKELDGALEPIEATTGGGYRTAATQLCMHIGDIVVHELTVTDLEDAYQELLKGLSPCGRPLKRKTVMNASTMLRTALRQAVRDGLVDQNVALNAKVPKVGIRPVTRNVFWRRDEVKAFLAATDTHPLFIAWMLAALTGMRRGEILGLEWACVDLDAGLIWVEKTRTTVKGQSTVKGVKSPASHRSVHIDRRTVALLRQWQERQSALRDAHTNWQAGDFVITFDDGTLPHPDKVSRAFASAVKQSGLRRITFHGLRHSWATDALMVCRSDPASVSAQLGHANEAITRALYKHFLPDLSKRVVEQVAEGFWGG